jgi:hypothetical protein
MAAGAIAAPGLLPRGEVGQWMRKVRVGYFVAWLFTSMQIGFASSLLRDDRQLRFGHISRPYMEIAHVETDL